MTRDSDSFPVEATTSFSGIVDENRQPTREAAILAAVGQATNPNFTFRLGIEQVGPDQPKVREITEPLERWLSSLDPDEVLGQSIFDAREAERTMRGTDYRLGEKRKRVFPAGTPPPGVLLCVRAVASGGCLEVNP